MVARNANETGDILRNVAGKILLYLVALAAVSNAAFPFQADSN